MMLSRYEYKELVADTDKETAEKLAELYTLLRKAGWNMLLIPPYNEDRNA